MATAFTLAPLAAATDGPSGTIPPRAKPRFAEASPQYGKASIKARRTHSKANSVVPGGRFAVEGTCDEAWVQDVPVDVPTGWALEYVRTCRTSGSFLAYGVVPKKAKAGKYTFTLFAKGERKVKATLRVASKPTGAPRTGGAPVERPGIAGATGYALAAVVLGGAGLLVARRRFAPYQG